MLKKFLTMCTVVGLVACGGGGLPTKPQETLVGGTGQEVQAVAPATPSASPSPSGDPLRPRDYLTILSRSQDASSVSITVRNKDNGEAYTVHSCQYTPGGAEGVLIDQDEAQIAPGGTLTLRVKKPSCGLTWQNDIAIQPCSKTPVFSPGFFIGYETGTVPACDKPKPKCEDFKSPELKIDFAVTSNPVQGGVQTTGFTCNATSSASLTPGVCASGVVSPAIGGLIPYNQSQTFSFKYSGTFSPAKGLSCPILGDPNYTVKSPPCRDKVTYTGKLKIYVSNAGEYSLNGGPTFHLGNNSTTYVPKPVDGASWCLSRPGHPGDPATVCKAASCGLANSWHSSLDFVCEAQHSCPQPQ